MRRWADCRTEQERRDALTAAFHACPDSATAVAQLLGINRQYLYELLERYGDPRRGPVGTVSIPDRTDAVSVSDTVGRPDTVGPDGADSDVGSTSSESLTYGRTKRIFRRVINAAVVTTEMPAEEDEPVQRVAFDLPKDVLDWLELEALRRKQRGGGRMAKSPIVIDLIRRAMASANGDR